MVRTIAINNFKGGVSKSSTTLGLAYILSQKLGYNTLVVDLDPQADTTDTLLLTFQKNSKKDLYYTLKDNDSINESLVSLNQSLDLIPSNFNMIGFPHLLEDLNYSRTSGATIIDKYISPIKENYDFILIDTPPTISDYSSNAIYACDYSLIVMQTHKRSYKAVEKFISYLAKFQDAYQKDFEVLGILPVMFKKDGKVDNQVIAEAENEYGEYLFDKCVYQRDRVKRWDVTGITDEDHHDRKTLKMYQDITENLIEKINYYEKE
jgi:chromosome partitioning protein